MSIGAAFLNARDYLLANRSQYDAALRGFSWPHMDQFNWALDYFDIMAAGNAAPALFIVEEGGTETRCPFAQLACRSNQIANFLRSLGVRRGDHIC